MGYRLVHLSGSLAGHVREISDRETILGRDPAMVQVVFGPEDKAVSRRHVLLVFRDGKLVIRDLNSSTGTFVDGENVAEAELRHGDVFELGRGGPSVRVEMEDSGTATVVMPAVSTARSLTTPPASPRPPGSASTPAGPGSKLRLTFLSGTRREASLDLAGSVLRIGRAAGNTVWTPEDKMVSAQHAKIVRLEDGYVLMDLESTNGTFLNGQRVQRGPLTNGDVIMLGDGGPELRVDVIVPARAARALQATVVIPNFAELAGRRAAAAFLREVPLDRDLLTIGRGEDVDLRLDSPIVSRSHARIERRDGAMAIVDLDSANGTYVGSKRVARCALAPGDRIVVGPFQIEVASATVRILDTRNRARLDARGISAEAGGRAILENVSLSLPPGSFTAIIGPSGAGKSTLLSALNGARPATRGAVLLNGLDLYRSFDALKATLGHVPQDDIVHRELTVAESLACTARLRLPSDSTRAEREKRITEVLATLELSERRDTEIRRLSGGQRKRVSIAAELLTEPNLLFLDEPTSGLDPGLEEALMLLLRELSYKGKTVVLVTHTLDNIHLCDAVTLLVDGRLAFYGSTEEARAHFGIQHMVNLYTRLKERPAEAWETAFRETETHKKRVDAPLTTAPPSAAAMVAVRGGEGGPGPRALRQLPILTGRYLRTLTRDARNAVLLFAQAPLIAGLIGLSLLYGQSDIAYTKPKNTILFLLALTAVWFGCSNAVREIVKERAIYLRERMVNLRVLPYVLSKVVVLTGLAALQCVAFFLILDLWFGIPGRPVILVASMLLASLVGILLGLAISALVSTPDRAMTLLPIILIPQVLFTIPSVQMDMKGPAGIVARAMPTWWAYDLLRRVALEPDEALADDALEARMAEGRLVLITKRRLERMVQEGYMLFNYRGVIETTWVASLPERTGAFLPERWGARRPAIVDAVALAFFAAVLLAVATFAQKRLDRRS
jgi:ABC-type multidrug transport system ATPase subunit/pSer/pThr/pTyr-binding forkhead associated (FHA) protein